MVNHQKLHFTTTQKKLVWKTPLNMDGCTISHFQINLMAVSGCEIDQIQSWTTNETHLTILSTDLVGTNGNLLYINITAVDSERVCIYLDNMIHLDPFGRFINNMSRHTKKHSCNHSMISYNQPQQ